LDHTIARLIAGTCVHGCRVIELYK
jgi:hypothetical protein